MKTFLEKGQFRHYLQGEIFNAVEAFAMKIGKMEADEPLAEAYGRVHEDLKKGRMLAEIALDDILNFFLSVISKTSGPPPINFYARLLQLRNGIPPNEDEAWLALLEQFNLAAQHSYLPFSKNPSFFVDTRPTFIHYLKGEIPDDTERMLSSMWGAVCLKMKGLRLTEQQLEAVDHTPPVRSYQRPGLVLAVSN